MIRRILSRLGLAEPESSARNQSRRRHYRRSGPSSLIMVNENNYLVKDWSPGGVFFDARDGRFLEGEQLLLTLRFKLENEHVDITHAARIVRAAKDGVAAQFEPLTRDVRRQFGRVIDAMVAANFAESQKSGHAAA